MKCKNCGAEFSSKFCPECGTKAEENKREEVVVNDNVQTELHDFIENLMEVIEEFENTEFENDDDELYEYDGSIECDADDYNEDGFAMKAKAKIAGKEALEQAIKDVQKLYKSAKKELVDATKQYYMGMSDAMSEFVDTVYESYDTLKDIYCTDEVKKYLEEKAGELGQIIPRVKDSLAKNVFGAFGLEAFATLVEHSSMVETRIRPVILEEYERAVKALTKEHFDEAEKKALNMKELFEMCEYDEYLDEYAFDITNACEHLVTAYENIIQTEEDELPKDVYEAFHKVNDSYVKSLKDWINGLEVEFRN